MVMIKLKDGGERTTQREALRSPLQHGELIMNKDFIEAGSFYEVEYEGRAFIVEAMWPSLTFEDAWLVSRVDNGRTFVLPAKHFVRPVPMQSSNLGHARRSRHYAGAR